MTATEYGRKPIIKVRSLHKYFGPLHVIRGVDLDVQPGEVVVIMGPSGAGKSTFLRCLNFLEEPSSGVILIDAVEIDIGQPVAQREQRLQQIRQDASMIFQEFNLFPHMTVLGNIIEGAVRVKKEPKKQAIARAEALLAGMDLLGKRDAYPSQLAAGEQQRVAIARSLCMQPKILLFDDPTSALDPSLVVAFIDIITRLAGQGIAIIITTNEPFLTRSTADRVILLDQGVWVEMAPPEQFFTNPGKARTRQFLAHISLKDIRIADSNSM